MASERAEEGDPLRISMEHVISRAHGDACVWTRCATEERATELWLGAHAEWTGQLRMARGPRMVGIGEEAQASGHERL